MLTPQSWTVFCVALLMAAPTFAGGKKAPEFPIEEPAPSWSDKEIAAANWVEIRFPDKNNEEKTLWSYYGDFKTIDSNKSKAIPLYDLTSEGEPYPVKIPSLIFSDDVQKIQKFTATRSAEYTGLWAPCKPSSGRMCPWVAYNGEPLSKAKLSRSDFPGIHLDSSQSFSFKDTLAGKNELKKMLVRFDAGKEAASKAKTSAPDATKLANLVIPDPDTCVNWETEYGDEAKVLLRKQRMNRQLFPMELRILRQWQTLIKSESALYDQAIEADEKGHAGKAEAELQKFRKGIRETAKTYLDNHAALPADSLDKDEMKLLLCYPGVKRAEYLEKMTPAEKKKFVAAKRDFLKKHFKDYLAQSAKYPNAEMLPTNLTVKAVGGKDAPKKVAAISSDAEAGKGSAGKIKKGGAMQQAEEIAKVGDKGGDKFDNKHGATPPEGGTPTTSTENYDLPMKLTGSLMSREIPAPGDPDGSKPGDVAGAKKKEDSKVPVATMAQSGIAGGIFGATQAGVWAAVITGGAAAASLATAGVGLVVVGAVAALIAFLKS